MAGIWRRLHHWQATTSLHSHPHTVGSSSSSTVCLSVRRGQARARTDTTLYGSSLALHSLTPGGAQQQPDRRTIRPNKAYEARLRQTQRQFSCIRLHGASGGCGTMKRVPCTAMSDVHIHGSLLHLPTPAPLSSPLQRPDTAHSTQPSHLSRRVAAEHNSVMPRWTNIMFSLRCLPERRRRLRRWREAGGWRLEAGRAGWEDCIVSHKKGGKGGMAGGAAAALGVGTHHRLYKLPNEATFSLFLPLSPLGATSGVTSEPQRDW